MKKFFHPNWEEIAKVNITRENDTLTISGGKEAIDTIYEMMSDEIEHIRYSMKMREEAERKRKEEEAKRKRDNKLYLKEAQESVAWIKEHKNLDSDEHLRFPKTWKPYRRDPIHFFYEESSHPNVIVANDGNIYAEIADAAKRLNVSKNILGKLKMNEPKKVQTNDGKSIAVVKMQKEDIVLAYRFITFQDCFKNIIISQIRARREMYEKYQNCIDTLNALAK